jgi:hypothetical protein
MNLSIFNNNLFEAGTEFFNQLGIQLNSNTASSLGAKELLKDHYKDKGIYKAIDEAYFLGLVDDSVFDGNTPLLNKEKISLKEAEDRLTAEYNGLMVFAVWLKDSYSPTRGEIADLTRAFNMVSKSVPVVLLLKYGGLLSFAASERTKYKQAWREGEKIGKISLLKDIKVAAPHTGHLKILDDLKVAPAVTDFNALYKQWQKVFDVQLLNASFYRKISAWYYYATSTIKLPIRPEYYKDDKENVKNFTVRLICRMMFCWFLKEKGLIARKLLELYDYADNPIILVNKTNKEFGTENSYYRYVLQNIFLSCLNSPMNTSKRRAEYLGKRYLPDDFDYSLLDRIPFLNGGLFDRLEEDNYNEKIEDGPLYIPNELFYARKLQVGTGKNAKETQGLNLILSQYVFTVDENTPLEEEVALDPELLGLVFENLLAEIDPDEDIAKTARRESGSFYTPRKIIDNMVNASLMLYLTNYFKQLGQKGFQKKLYQLIYQNKVDEHDQSFKEMVVDALDKIKVLDPACGSGAFPMGMLHKIVAILKLVDHQNHLWLKKQLSRIEDKFQRDNFAKILEQHMEDYPRKLGIIKNAIYGIDNQPLAVLITKLRFFISLLVEQNIDLNHPQQNYHIEPLPNMETKIICADSLRDLQPDLFSENIFNHLKEAKEKYYKPKLTREEKDAIAMEVAELMNQCYPSFAEQILGKLPKADHKTITARNKAVLKNWFQHANLCAPFFNLDLFFPELSHQPFDIVIGNPPYGGKDISDDVKNKLALGKKDPYGAFIARFLGNGENITPLKNRGILAYIVSDTFMTIKTHFPLRQQMMRNYIYKMIRVHPDTFRATVNTVVIICERNVFPPGTPADQKKINPAHHCQMVDMTNVSIHDDYERFLEILYKTEGFEERESISSPEYAIYYYPQELIRTNSNLPFFVAAPKLFVLMNDITAPVEYVDLSGKPVQVRKISLNGKGINLAKLGQIAEVKQGLATGDNDSYLFQNPEARGTYRSIDDFKDYLLTDDDIQRIIENAKLRADIIEKGISKNPKSSRYFGGRYILPYDKGGEADIDEGWLPNYYVPTNYYIDWSEWALKRMKTLTIKDRDGKGPDKICSRFQNVEYTFYEGITYSRTGIYAPTFRLNNKGAFDSKSNALFIGNHTLHLGVLSSIMVKVLFKAFLCHTVQAEGDAVEEIPIPSEISNVTKIKSLVDKIILRQNENPRYDYASNEQIEIDRLVYEAYGLNDEDIAEVENWYARRYPRLVKAQNNKKI